MFNPDLYLLEPRHQRFLEQGQGRIFAYRANFEAPCLYFFFGLLIALATVALLPLLWHSATPRYIAVLVIGTNTLLTLLLMWQGIHYPRLLRRLGREGQVVQGEVMRVRVDPPRKNKAEPPRIEIRYEFLSPTSGQTVKAEVTIFQRDRERPLPKKGTLLAVLYVADTFYKPL